METPMQVTQFHVPPGSIDLGLGDPQFSLLPIELMQRAAEEHFRQNDPEFLQYGAEQGDGNFLLALAKVLSRTYGFPVRSDSLFTTSGASMGMHLICTYFTHPGDTVFIEEPTYFCALRIFADHDLKMVPIRTDENGIMIESLEEELARSRPKFLYIIPTYQNPTGHTLSPERRKQLLALSRQHNFLVVADEVYHSLKYSGQAPNPFASEIEGGNVISLGSFSKILAPGLRLGWIQADQDNIHRFVNSGLLDSGGGMNPFTSAIVCRVLESGGLDENIAKLVTTYGKRVAVMDAALRHHLPGVEYTVPKGGYFFWLHLPNGIDASELQRRARAFKVGFRPGSLFSCQGGMQDFVRLSYVFYESDELEQGVLRLKRSLEKMGY
jgi:2-aminoadipate transaminase